jgi:hypothetical protein
MTTATSTVPAPTPSVDPVLARAPFVFDLEMGELRATVPQAAPITPVASAATY